MAGEAHGSATARNGISGISTVTSGVGVYGVVNNPNGLAGVHGVNTFNGVFGYLGAQLAGVFGSSANSSIPGVAGYCTTAGTGDFGSGSNYGVYAAGNPGYTGSLTHVSDARYKTNILTLDTVQNLRGVSYEWRRDEFPQMNFGPGRQKGFIAQEIETVLPDLAHKDKDGFRSVDYVQVIPVLVEAMKAQQKQRDELKAQAKENADIKKQLAELAALVKKLQDAQNK